MSDDGSSSAGRRPLNVLQIIGNGIVGGMESYVHNLISQLPGDQFRLTCLCPYESAFTSGLRSLGCEVFITPLRDDPPWRSIQMAVEVIRNRHIDLIHAHLPNAHVLAGIVARLTHTPAVSTIHSMNLSMHELIISRLTGTRLLMVCQEAYAQALAAGVPDERLTLIHNGVNLNLFKPERRGSNFRQQFGIPAAAPLIGFIGRLAWEKGPDKFVQMAARIHNHLPRAHFAMVGEGPLEDEISELITRMKAGHFVHMAGLQTKPWEIYPEFDLFAQTSRSEAMPLALLEAMACGLPVIAMSVGGVAELVEAGTTGILVSPGDWPGVGSPYPGDWEGVAAAMLELLAQPEKLKRMGEAGRKRVEEKFDLRHSTRRTAELFQRLVRSGSQLQEGWQTLWPSMNGFMAPTAVDQHPTSVE